MVGAAGRGRTIVLTAGDSQDRRSGSGFNPNDNRHRIGVAQIAGNQVMNYLFELRQMQPLSIWWMILTLMALAVLLGPVDYCVLKRLDKQPLHVADEHRLDRDLHRRRLLRRPVAPRRRRWSSAPSPFWTASPTATAPGRPATRACSPPAATITARGPDAEPVVVGHRADAGGNLGPAAGLGRAADLLPPGRRRQSPRVPADQHLDGPVPAVRVDPEGDAVLRDRGPQGWQDDRRDRQHLGQRHSDGVRPVRGCCADLGPVPARSTKRFAVRTRPFRLWSNPRESSAVDSGGRPPNMWPGMELPRMPVSLHGDRRQCLLRPGLSEPDPGHVLLSWTPGRRWSA